MASCGGRPAFAGTATQYGPVQAREALERLGGISAAAPIVAASSRKRLRTAVARGEIVKIGPNRYALPTSHAGQVAAAATHGHLSHLSAAAHWGWELWRQPEAPQVVVPRHDQRHHRGVWAEVRSADLAPGDRRGWATAPVRTVLDCARDLPFGDALAVADSALRHGSAKRDVLLAAAKHAGLEGRAMLVVQWADGRAANPFESALRALAIEAGLLVVVQYEIRAGSLVLHPDLADPFAGIAVEAESWTFHAGKHDHDRDCARFNALAVAGWLVLRFTWTQVMHSPSYVLRELRAAHLVRAAGA